MTNRVCMVGIALALTGCAGSEVGEASAPLNEPGAPITILAPGDGFVADPTLTLVAQISPAFVASQKHTVAMLVSVPGCFAATYRPGADGTLAGARNRLGRPVGNWTWTVSVDLSACQCHPEIARVHHCDGCGRTFTTCGDAAGCTPPPATAIARAWNEAHFKNGQPALVPACDSDFDGDGVPECALVAGVVGGAAAPTVVDQWVPAKYWADDDTVCIDRGVGGGCTDQPKPNQGGDDSCLVL